MTSRKSIPRTSKLSSTITTTTTLSLSSSSSSSSARSSSLLQWIDLQIPFDEMNPSNTLNMGQCFNWRKIESLSSLDHHRHYWIGVLDGLPLLIKQTAASTYVSCVHHDSLASYIAGRSERGASVKLESHKRSEKSKQEEPSSGRIDKPLKKKLKTTHHPPPPSTTIPLQIKSETLNPIASPPLTLQPWISPEEETILKSKFQDYFQLQISLLPLYQLWNQQCSRMKIVTNCLQGVRVVRQDPWECLISFICSSNNNISRISLMLDRLRKKYGVYLCSVIIRKSTVDVCHDKNEPDDIRIEKNLFVEKSVLIPKEEEEAASPANSQGLNDNEIIERFDLYSFPTAQVIAEFATEEELRSLGMGYRAKFILETSKLVMNKPFDYFEQLRQYGRIHRIPKEEHHDPTTNPEEDLQKEITKNRLLVQDALLEFPGVGQKVADCVALFSLDQSETIPIDTHVWSIAMRDYASTVLTSEQYQFLRLRKSLTPTVYEEIGGIFRTLFQQKAGWAHSVLFAAELPNFRILLPEELQQQMKDYDNQQRLEKKTEKEEKAAKKALIKDN